MEKEINARLGAGAAAWNRYKYTVFTNKHLSLRSKITMFKVAVIPALLYAAEVWIPTKADLHRITVRYNSYVRQLLGVRWWQHRSTDECLSICHLPRMERYIASRCLRWFGHVSRMPPERMPTWVLKPVFAAEIRGTRKLPNAKQWESHVRDCKVIAINHYPKRQVPRPDDIVQFRDEWRVFSAPIDISHSWNRYERSAFFQLHREGTITVRT